MLARLTQWWKKRLKQWQLLLLSFCLVICFLGLLGNPEAQAQSVDQLRQQQQQLEQKRLQMQQQRDRLQQQESAAQQKLKGLHQNIQVTDAQIKANEAKLEQANQQLAEIEQKLLQTENSFRQKQMATAARLRFLQRQQVDRGWAILLQSENMSEFLARRYQLKQVYTADRKMLASLRQGADQIDQQRNQVAKKKNEVALLTQQLHTQKAQYQKQAGAQQNMVERLQSDRRALAAAETQLEQDSRNITVLIQRKLAASRTAVRGSGQMVFPTNGAITSTFGWRVHPILGYERFHGGIDFGADYGTPIYAADRGTVIFSGWYGGYGNAVIVDHGGSMTTLYAHASELYVSEGQTVERGQAIAAVGSTGFSTGPHLHFEVRRDGEPIDPAPYL